MAQLWAKCLRHPCRPRETTAAERGGKLEGAHLWAKWLRHPCRLGDPHRCRAEGKITSGPLMGKVGTSPLPSRGSPPLQSGGGGGSEVAHLWAKWLRHPCRLGDPHRCRARGKIRTGPQVGKMATSPLPSRGSPPLESGGGNEKWPTCGQSGYITPAVSGIPTVAKRGGNQKWPTCGQSGYVTPVVSGIPTAAERGGGGMRSGPQGGKVATSPLPSQGSPPLQSGGGNQKWPTYGQSGYVTPAVSGIPTAAERGGEITSGPLMGKVATSPLPSRGSPPLQSGGGGGDEKWPTSGQSGYVTPAVSGIATAAERGGKSEVAHLWAKWLRQPCRLGDPHRCRAGGKITSGPLMGKVATSPLPSRGSPPLHSGGAGNQKWPTSGQSGYVTPAISGIPTAAERGGGGDEKWPTSGQSGYVTLPSRGSPPLQSGGGNRKWPTYGQSGYVTPAVSGIPPLQSGGGIRSGPQVGKMATSPLPSR